MSTSNIFSNVISNQIEFTGDTIKASEFVQVNLTENQGEEKITNISTHEFLTYPLLMQQYNTFTDYYNIQRQKDIEKQNRIAETERRLLSIYNQNFANQQYVPYSIINIPDGWDFIRQNPDLVTDLINIFTFLKRCLSEGKVIFPRESNMFRAFELCPLNNIKVVILGQDPYETVDELLGIEKATGLSFSGHKGGRIPYSLSRIFTELRAVWPDIRLEHGDLTSWAQQGVFLLNTALSVTKDEPNSHGKTGIYTHFMQTIIKTISETVDGVIFLLWGREAEKFEPFIGKKSYVEKCGHPSSRNSSSAYKFEARFHFVKVYHYLEQMGKQQINWSLIN